MFVILRPVGLACQSSCRYCYYKAGHRQLRDSSPGRLDLDLAQKLVRELLTIPGSHTICFHGGEPLLVGKGWFAAFVGFVEEHQHQEDVASVSLALQTNGLLIDREWVDIFRRGKIGVSVSVDGPEVIHDHARRNTDGEGTFRSVMGNVELLRDYGFRVTAISVVTRRTLDYSPQEYLRFFASSGFREIDITPYVETGESEVERLAREEFEPPPERLLPFFTELFDAWFFASDPRVEVRSFEQTVGALLGFVPSLCTRQRGISCGHTPCLMPDGQMFACDLETEGGELLLGNLSTEPLSNIASEARLGALHNRIRAAFATKGCEECELFGFCSYACPRFAFSKRNYGAYCDLTRAFVGHVKHRIESLSLDLFDDRVRLAL